MPYYRCPACGLTSYSAAAYSSARLCPGCLGALPDDAKRHLSPRITSGIKRVLPTHADSVPKARRAVAALALPETARAKLELLVSELVTNAVRHSGLTPADSITLRIDDRHDRVRATVHDGGEGFTSRSFELADSDTMGGQGLVIVSAMSDDWGVQCNAEGCAVWCEVNVREARTGAVGDETERRAVDAV